MNAVAVNYIERIDKVINYINAHLDQSFKLEELAKVAHFSPYHFHRIFVAVVGESVNFYTNRIRLEKAVRLLKYSSDSIQTIAYQCGFSSASTFSRSFKDYFSTSPSQFKKTGIIENSKIRKELFPMHEYLVPMSLEEKQTTYPVSIKSFPKRNIAYIRVVNSYTEGVVANAYENLVSWTKEMGYFDNSTFFGMSLDDPMTTPKDKYRYEACVSIPKEVSKLRHPIQQMVLPACNYATTIVRGDIQKVATGTHYLFEEWLLNSEYEPLHMHGMEIFLDRNQIHNWEHFELELCIPVKKF
ncbi:MAG: GyrI-like domain-containing protein [Bacteroidota bacterium]